MKKWIGPFKSTYLDLPEDLHRLMRSTGIEEGRKAAEIYIEAATMLLEHRKGGGNPSAKETQISANDLSGIPQSVVDLVRTHAHDPRCLECVLALGRIWDMGDEDVKDAISRNCRVFARASDALQRISHDSTVDDEGRVRALLDDEARGDAEINHPPEAGRATGASRARVPGVGKAPAGKSRKRG